MSSIRDRAKLYQQAAEETAKFGDLDTPLEKEWTVDPSAIDEEAIAKKALEYEKTVKILRADQDTPGLIAKLGTGSGDVQVTDDSGDDNNTIHVSATPNKNTNNNDNATDNVASPRSNKLSIAAKALEYERNVQDLLADQDTPGILEKLRSQRSELPASNGAASGINIISSSEEGASSTTTGFSSGRDVEMAFPRRRPFSTENNNNTQAETSNNNRTGGGEYTGGDAAASRRQQRYASNINNNNNPSSVRTLGNESFYSADSHLSSDDFGSITDLDDDTKSESVVRLEALQAGNEFTNDAMPVNDEEDLAPGSYLERRRHGEEQGNPYPDRAPTLASFASGQGEGGTTTTHARSVHSHTDSASISSHSISGTLSQAHVASSYTLSSRSHSMSAREEEEEGVTSFNNNIGGSIRANDGVENGDDTSVDIDIDIDIDDIGIDIGEEEGYSKVGKKSEGRYGDTSRDRARGIPAGRGRRRRVVVPPRRDTGRRLPTGGARGRPWLPPEDGTTTTTSIAIDPIDMVDDLRYDMDLEEENEGIRSGWARPHNDRLPKAKVVIARRRSNTDITSSSTTNTNTTTGSTSSAGAPMSLPSKNHERYNNNTTYKDGPATAPDRNARRLVKQYKDRNELLAGRVSHVKMGTAGASGRLGAHHNNIEREERVRRHNAGVARRSSLVAGTLDRVSMAADPFIDFMDTRGGMVPGPKKPKGGLRKMMRKLFRRGRRNRDLLKSA